MADKVKLLVEGKNDQKVVEHLLDWHKVDRRNVLILSEHNKGAGGLENLLDVLPTRLVETGTIALGIIVDADDTGVEVRWQQITTILKKAGYSKVPDQPVSGGSIINRESTDRRDLAKKSVSG